MKSPRAWMVALALSAGALGSLALAPASMAAAPTAGTNCQAQTGKISGRGSTLQIWLQYDLMGAYASDVCGPVASDTRANGGDITDPGSPIYTLSGGTTYAQNWMTAYDYTSAQALGASGANAGMGSGAGETAIGCRAEAFSGTDIPVTAGQLGSGGATANTLDGPVVAQGGTLLGKNCDPTGTSGALVSPFPPAANYPNPGDQQQNSGLYKGVMLFPVGMSAVSIFANLPTSCVTGTTPVVLSTADMQAIWGGTDLNWNQITDAGTGNLGSNCNVPITRVVRSDNSGTTQAFDNYMADAFGYTTATCNSTTGNATSFGQMQNNQANGTSGGNVNWPNPNGINAGASANCNAIVDSSSAGGPALISLAETTNGGVGYADLADTRHDTNNFQSSITGNSIYEFSIVNNAGTAETPNTSTNASNCSTSEALPGGTGGAVGTNGGWNLLAQTTPGQGVDDVTWTKQGATNYPVCSLTWDFVWTGENGNTPPSPTTTGGTLPLTSGVLNVSSLAGVPNQGSFTVADSSTSSPETLNYTGVATSTTACSPVAAPCLTGVSGGTSGATITSGTSLTFPLGTGGPEANLNADQRRTEYSYFTYLMSDAAQSTEAGANYAPLPAAWLSTIRKQFQAAF